MSNEGEKEKETSKGCSNDEILAILGHELGHWKLSHNLKNLGISQVNILQCSLVLRTLARPGDNLKSLGISQVNTSIVMSFAPVYCRPAVLSYAKSYLQPGKTKVITLTDSRALFNRVSKIIRVYLSSALLRFVIG